MRDYRKENLRRQKRKKRLIFEVDRMQWESIPQTEKTNIIALIRNYILSLIKNATP